MNSDETVENAWMRARMRCECEHRGQRASGRCDRELVWEHRGRVDCDGAWEARRDGGEKATGWEAVNQCAILCWDCYRSTCEGCPMREHCPGGAVRQGLDGGRAANATGYPSPRGETNGGAARRQTEQSRLRSSSRAQL